LLIGIFGVGIGMWSYHSIAAGVKNAARIASVRGAGSTTIGDYAHMMLSSGVPGASTVRFKSSGASDITCDKLSECVSNSTVWPSTAPSATSHITISASFPFQALLPMATIAGSSTIGSETFGAESRQMVQF